MIVTAPSEPVDVTDYTLMRDILLRASSTGDSHVTVAGPQRDILVRIVDPYVFHLWYILSTTIHGVLTDFVVFGSRADAVQMQGDLITAANPEKPLN